MTTSKKIALNILLASFIFLLLYAVSQSGREQRGYSTGDIEAHYGPVTTAMMTQYPASIRLAVKRMIEAGTNPDDLDFTLPGEPGHGLPDKKNSVFGEQKEKDSSAIWPMLPPVVLSIAKKRAFDGEPHYVFTGANRISAVGTDAPEIIYIAWPITKIICSRINNGLGLVREGRHILMLDNPPDLTPLHSEAGRPVTKITIPTAPGIYPGVVCAQDKNGVRYYIHAIVER